jgi:two-component system chemotaxis response regulator CheB
MPEMDGLQALRAIRRTRQKLPVIMFSTLTEAGATATLSALAAGASDYVTKPSNTGSFAESRLRVQEQLIPRIHALCKRPVYSPPPRPLARPAAGGRPAGPTRPGVPGAAPVLASGEPKTGRIDILAVGCSTGGPEALATVVNALPARFPVPIVVVQHMPALFTTMFAQRLDRSATVRVVEASGAMQLAPGTVYIAPGDQHLEVVKRGAAVVTRLHAGPPENFCRPAVDVLFRSVAQVYGKSTLAVVLTGMGQDGKRGAEPLQAAGAEVIVQDEQTSVVWGMPGAIASAGLADAVLPLGQIASHVITRAAQGRSEQQKKAVLSWR